jgi:integrase
VAPARDLFQRRRALITEAVVDVNGHAVFGTPKTRQRRQVPIPRFLAEELVVHVADKEPGDFRFPAEKGGVPLAIVSGANVKVVQTMLGHQSATMTLDLYGHLLADQLDEVADAMNTARAAGAVACRPTRFVAALPVAHSVDSTPS